MKNGGLVDLMEIILYNECFENANKMSTMLKTDADFAGPSEQLVA